MAQSPSDISPNDDAAKIRVAALEAAKTVPGASLGEGDLNQVIDHTRSSPAGSDERMTKAAGLATTIAKAQSERPLNYLSASPQEVERERVALGLPPLSGVRVQGRFSDPERDGDGRSSGARYDGMNGAALTQLQLQTRDYAIRQGVLWAADNKEILKLGPDAIDVLARTGLRKDVYAGMRDVGLSAKGSIGLADKFHRAGMDANTEGEAVAKNLKEINDAKYTASINKLGELKPNATEAEKAAAVDNIKKAGVEAAKRHPKAAATIKKTNDMVEQAARRTATEAVSTNNKAVQSEAKVKTNDDLIGSLNSTAPATETAKQDQGKPKVAQAAKPKL